MITFAKIVERVNLLEDHFSLGTETNRSLGINIVFKLINYVRIIIGRDTTARRERKDDRK